jgi:ketosteroid isomerase-like protein
MDVGASERAAIRRVIEQQLEAFKRRDAKAAFAHAAPAIQELFGTPEVFMLMVAREYPPIHRPRSYTFGGLEIVGGEFTQNVIVVGEDGEPASAFYLMARQEDGSWRILGCILVPIAKTVI